MTMERQRYWQWSLFLVLMLSLPIARAHDARPVTVTITETLPGIYQLSLRVPATLESANIPAVIWPSSCTAQRDAGSELMHCGGDLAGEQFSLQYPMANPSLATFYRLNRLEGGIGHRAHSTAPSCANDGCLTGPRVRSDYIPRDDVRGL